MEIVRTTPHSPLKFRPRSRRVAFEQGLRRTESAREPAKSVSAMGIPEDFDLEEVTARLEEAGETLENDPTFDNFLSFKESMGKFARTATSLAYSLDKIFTPKQRSHLVTRVLDKNAAVLYGETMNSQRFNIGIASEIDDIKGMILNNCI
jgi:uncharacterized protein YaaR (DUF327 family)